MKLTSTVKTLVAMALAAFAAASAKAALPAYYQGDLLLGFYDYSSTIKNDYIVNLGPLSNLSLYGDFTLTANDTALASDLSTVFGSSWYTDNDIVYGFAAAYTSSSQLFLSNPNAGTPWLESNAQSAPAQSIASTGGLISNASPTGSYPNGLSQSDATPNSWYANESGDFNDGNLSGPGGDNGISDYVSNPIEFDAVTAVSSGHPAAMDFGTFALSSNGAISYTTAVPEPSTFAALGLGAAVLAFARRRRSISRS